MKHVSKPGLFLPCLLRTAPLLIPHFPPLNLIQAGVGRNEGDEGRAFSPEKAHVDRGLQDQGEKKKNSP